MMLSMASSPSSIPLMGTPMTGNVVEAAITPGRAAAIPAAAMMTFNPRSLAWVANCSTASGVRCAERALTSKGICKASSCLQAFSITGRSDVLPMIMLTNGVIFYFIRVVRGSRVIRDVRVIRTISPLRRRGILSKNQPRLARGYAGEESFGRCRLRHPR